VECDSAATANAIYEEIDGLEFEKSQNILDVRCVPDDVAFDNEPHDACDEPPSEIDFALDALQQAPLAHSKVKLTWDDEDDKGDRLVLKKRKFTNDELERIDYSNYLASSDEDSDDSDAGPTDTADIDRKRQLLREMVREAEAEEDAERPDGELEITWSVGLKERAARLLAEREERASEAQMTVGEKLDKKRREKKRLRKQRLKELVAGKGKGDNDDEEEEEDLDERVGGDDAYFRQDLTAEFSDSDGEGVPMDSGSRGAGSSSDESDTPVAAAIAPAKNARKGGPKGASAKRAAKDTSASLHDGDDDDDSRHFDMTQVIRQHRLSNKKVKAKHRKKTSEVADDFKLDTSDDRFAAVFSDKVCASALLCSLPITASFTLFSLRFYVSDRVYASARCAALHCFFHFLVCILWRARAPLLFFSCPKRTHAVHSC
jgi:hypothetical protein